MIDKYILIKTENSEYATIKNSEINKARDMLVLYQIQYGSSIIQEKNLVKVVEKWTSNMT